MAKCNFSVPLLTLLLTLSLCPLSASAKGAQKVGESTLPNGLKVEEYRLDNGMQLLLIPDHSAPVFSYQVWYKVGSASERLDPKLNHTGLAHLFEHMMFRGTKKNPDQVFDAKISAAGAVGNNATTWYDRTCYFESLPKERLELIFDLESDRMGHLDLDEKLFKTELGAVIGEFKMDADKPMRVAHDDIWDLAFTTHPYKYTTMGTLDELHHFTVDDAKYFYKTYYAPNDATLILIGDISIPKAIALAEKYYGPYKAQEIPKREAAPEPEQTSARTFKTTHPLANSDIVLVGYKTPGINNPDSAALEVAAALLSYGDSSRLQQDLVEKGIASSTFANAYKLRYPGLFIIGAEAAPGKTADDILPVIEANIKKLRKGEINETELQRAKNQFLLNSYNELGEQSNIAQSLGEALVSSDNYKRGFEILEESKKVSLQDVQRVADQYFIEQHSNTVIMSPVKGAQK